MRVKQSQVSDERNKWGNRPEVDWDNQPEKTIQRTSLDKRNIIINCPRFGVHLYNCV